MAAANIRYQVVTSLRLRELPPVSKSQSKTERLDLSQSAALSSNVKYDPESGLISFVALDINTCVQEFLEEWERVQRIACIAREGWPYLPFVIRVT